MEPALFRHFYLHFCPAPARRLAAQYGYDQIGQERLTNDALIAINAGRLGVKVITTINEPLAGWPIFEASSGR